MRYTVYGTLMYLCQVVLWIHYVLARWSRQNSRKYFFIVIFISQCNILLCKTWLLIILLHIDIYDIIIYYTAVHRYLWHHYIYIYIYIYKYTAYIGLFFYYPFKSIKTLLLYTYLYAFTAILTRRIRKCDPVNRLQQELIRKLQHSNYLNWKPFRLRIQTWSGITIFLYIYKKMVVGIVDKCFEQFSAADLTYVKPVERLK